MTTVALAVYAVLLVAAAAAVWRRPVLALYVFIVGLALHNAAMDALYGWGIRGDALTAIQAWKDVLLLVALTRVAFDAVRTRRLPFRRLPADGLALAFAAIVVLYALIPQDALAGHATHKAIAYALRHDLDWWRHNGTVGYFSDQLGYPYGPGLSHLPDNFVYNNGNEHELTRRLVSTFLSPLGSAYLCAVALLLAPRTRLAIPFAALAAAGLLWTHTRAALLGLAVGFAIVAAVCRRAWPLAAAVATLAVGFAFLAVFPDIGPRAHFTPRELAYQRAHAHATGRTKLEPSAESHLSNLWDGLQTVAKHPQGYGLGNAGEVAFREHVPLKAGESNYTELGVETGLVGALLFIAWNLALLVSLVRSRRAALAAMFAAVLVVAIQTDAYGIPWLAYCVWWLAGSGMRNEHRPAG